MTSNPGSSPQLTASSSLLDVTNAAGKNYPILQAGYQAPTPSHYPQPQVIYTSDPNHDPYQIGPGFIFVFQYKAPTTPSSPASTTTTSAPSAPSTSLAVSPSTLLYGAGAVALGAVNTGETNATIEGKLAHAGFGQGVKLSSDAITDRLSIGEEVVGVNELKPEGRLANTGKFNQAINQLYRQMAAAAEKFKGKTVDGSLWVWQRTATGFRYVKVMTIRMGGAANGIMIGAGVLGDAADRRELHSRARLNGRGVEEQNRIEMLERGPMIQTPYGPIPNPYYLQPFDPANAAEMEARRKGTML